MEVYRIEGYPQKNGKLAGIAMMSYTIIHVYIYIRTTHMGPTTKKKLSEQKPIVLSTTLLKL